MCFQAGSTKEQLIKTSTPKKLGTFASSALPDSSYGSPSSSIPGTVDSAREEFQNLESFRTQIPSGVPDKFHKEARICVARKPVYVRRGIPNSHSRKLQDRLGIRGTTCPQDFAQEKVRALRGVISRNVV